MLKPWPGLEAGGWPPRAGDGPALTVSRTVADPCVLCPLLGRRLLRPCTLRMRWGTTRQQGNHRAEPLPQIFSSAVSRTWRGPGLCLRSYCYFHIPKAEAACCVHKQKAAPPPGNKFILLPRQSGWESSFRRSQSVRYISSCRVKDLTASAISGPLVYVPLYFIFMFIPPRICGAVCTFCAVGLGGGICEVMPAGNRTVNTLAPEALSLRSQRQQGREKQ